MPLRIDTASPNIGRKWASLSGRWYTLIYKVMKVGSLPPFLNPEYHFEKLSNTSLSPRQLWIAVLLVSPSSFVIQRSVQTLMHRHSWFNDQYKLWCGNFVMNAYSYNFSNSSIQKCLISWDLLRIYFWAFQMPKQWSLLKLNRMSLLMRFAPHLLNSKTLRTRKDCLKLLSKAKL